MAPQFPSIQSFYQPRHAKTEHTNRVLQVSPLSSDIGDGFTVEEVDAVLHPKINATWVPVQDYAEMDIDDLEPGPLRVTFQGRIANFYHQETSNKKPTAAKGCFKITVKDDTGAITVRLWYANLEYKLCFGQLVSIWTVHTSNGEHGHLASLAAPLFTSIFPERDRSCHFMLHENGDEGVICKTPLGYRDGHALNGLMTLQSFIDGGYDIIDGKILVCVKSIGAKKKIPSKKNSSDVNELITINIFDDTADAQLTLWGHQTLSAANWRPSYTTLLLTNPGWRIERKAWISVTSNTLLDVDPCITDVEWLRNFAQRMLRREHVNLPFPEGVFDLEIAAKSPNQILFTIADLDEFARAAPSEQFYGFLSVVILELHIVTMHRRNMLLCNECCGVPIFGNATNLNCKQCGNPVQLGVNPKILGTVVDETGSVARGKLILSSKAWEQLLGRSADDLAKSSTEVLKYLEQRILFLRVTFRFAWTAEAGDNVGRICVWEVKS